jgi:hypothetical protein
MVGERVPGGSLPDDPHDAEGFPLMTHEVVARMARETDGYMLPEVNDILWLSDKRWRAVAGLDAFTGVTILHLENNRIGPTLGDGLQAMRKLAVLHLNGNSLTSVDDARLARRHPSLVSVSLAGNRISRVSNDAFPNSLRTLSLAKNRLRDASAIEALSRLPDLETLDLGENELRDEDEDVLKVLAECPSLRALTLRGNPLQHSLGLDYRRALVSALPSLTCLDDKAVSAMERLGAEAWRRGGKSKQAEKEAKESLVFARDERRRAATRAAAAERAERRAKAEARQAEERDVAGASDERSNSGEAAEVARRRCFRAESLRAHGEDVCRSGPDRGGGCGGGGGGGRGRPPTRRRGESAPPRFRSRGRARRGSNFRAEPRGDERRGHAADAACGAVEARFGFGRRDGRVSGPSVGSRDARGGALPGDGRNATCAARVVHSDIV